MAETVRDESFQSREQQDLIQQEQQRAQMLGELQAEFVARSAAPATPREPHDIDEMIARAEALGGIYRPGGDEGVADPNFAGGRIEAANLEWQAVIDAIRRAKEAQIGRPRAAVARQFDLNPALPEAQAQPLIYLNDRVRQLMEAGLIKEETGRGVQPDGLFAGNRLVPTSTRLQGELDDLRTESIALVRDQVRTEVGDRLARHVDPEEWARGLGAELRDFVTRGLIDLEEVPVGGGGPRARGPRPVNIEIRAVNDPRARELSAIYREEFQAMRDTLLAGSPGAAALNTYLQSIRREIPGLRSQGTENRNDLMEGRDVERAADARRKIDDLNQAAQLREEQERIERSYAGNIAAKQTLDADEAANSQLEWMRAQQAEFRAAGVAMPRPTDTDAERAAKLERVRDYQYAQALEEDRGAAEQQEARDRYAARIAQIEARMAATPNRAVREELRRQIGVIEQERDATVNAMAQMQRAVAPGAAREAVDTIIRGLEGEHSYSSINSSDENFRERAWARREALGLEPVPFFEKRRGPIMEAYFRVPGNTHVVVMERYDRRSGRVLSQNMWSTEQEMTGNFRGSRWRREISDEVDSTREQDRQTAAATSRAGFWRRLRFRAGFGGTRNLDGAGGLYATYATNEAQRHQVAAHRRRGNALRFWLTGGRAQRS